MVDFSRFRAEGDLPVYLQIVSFFKRGCVSGAVQDGEELPSRRTLSALLGINPNTAQKLCRLLEDEGLLFSHGGAKSVVTLSPNTLGRLRHELLIEETRRAARTLREMGVKREEAEALLREAWEEDER